MIEFFRKYISGNEFAFLVDVSNTLSADAKLSADDRYNTLDALLYCIAKMRDQAYTKLLVNVPVASILMRTATIPKLTASKGKLYEDTTAIDATIANADK